MAEIDSISCITFRATTNFSEPHVLIKNDEIGCFASVAYLAEIAPDVQMVVNLESNDENGRGCFVSVCHLIRVQDVLVHYPSVLQISTESVHSSLFIA